ncbi:DUF3159 domain-containing protein [Curtobacterium ammoniigenes]|uniref:DUF3159 domain-containing protein n=1 Tax=Curtobacterium ammoniigenes TaxID=395387 RepID=UPI000833750E|nr:DUF3159 domain-containing protein [Curtobacterium ammoniigenes]
MRPAPDPDFDETSTAETKAIPELPSTSAQSGPARGVDQFRAAALRSGIAQVAPGERPSGSALMSALGGVRGLVESILPGFGFLVVFTVTRALVPSVLAPVVLAVIFVVVRIIQRQSPTSGIAGLVGVALSAGLALITGKPESNFLPGIVVNAVCLAVLLVSVAVRRPLIDVIVGLIRAAIAQETGGASTPSGSASVRQAPLVATWLWVGLFAVRLAIEVPLYVSAQVETLAAIKLITGVPLYAGVLWVTWLLCRSAVRPSR